MRSEPTDQPVDQREELEQLSGLLTGLSRSELIRIRELLEDRGQFAEHLSHALGEAIAKASKKEAFTTSIGPLIANGVLETARREPHKLGDAIAPALGPAMRGMITRALEKMNQTLETGIQTNLSTKGLKWRWESWRTGVPLMEIVYRDTMLFRVEHIMLIDQNSGALLTHAAQPDQSGKDPAVVSSMLTAVQDFVIDAFGAENSSNDAQSYQIGDLTAHVEHANGLALAAIVRGTVPISLKESLRERLESLYIMFGDELHAFSGDIQPFENATPLLRDCLVAQTHKDKRKSKRKPLVFVWLIGLIILGALSYSTYAEYQRRAHERQLRTFESTLRQQPGFVLTDLIERDRNLEIHGLLDTAAIRPSHLRPPDFIESVSWKLTPYYSAETGFLLERVKKALQPEQNVVIALQGTTLILKGEATEQWIESAIEIAPAILGVNHVDTHELYNLTQREIETLTTDIEAQKVYFEYAEAEFEAGQADKLSRLSKNMRRLKELQGQTGTDIRFLAHIDPIEWSTPRAEDYDRAKARASKLTERLGVPVEIGRVDIEISGQDTPNAMLQARILNPD